MHVVLDCFYSKKYAENVQNERWSSKCRFRFFFFDGTIYYRAMLSRYGAYFLRRIARFPHDSWACCCYWPGFANFCSFPQIFRPHHAHSPIIHTLYHKIKMPRRNKRCRFLETGFNMTVYEHLYWAIHGRKNIYIFISPSNGSNTHTFKKQNKK